MRPRRSNVARPIATLALVALGAATLVGAGGTAVVEALAAPAPAAAATGIHQTATKATKHTVSVRLPSKASTAKRTIKVSFTPKKPTTVKLQQWKRGKYVTIRTAKKPKGAAASFRYTPAKGKTKLRAVATWKKHRAVTPGKVTTWTSQGGATNASSSTTTNGAPSGVLDANGDPTVNLGEPAILNACWSYGANDARCRNAAVTAINTGRAREGLARFTLPANWTSLTPAQQLLVISNDERAVRGLRQISRLSTPLNALALTGAQTNSDPLLSGWVVEGKQAYGWASNWAITPGGPLYSNYLWMYDDGIGSGNIDCSTAHPSGCWGHRHNILAFGAADSSTSLVLGAAEATTTWSGWSGLSDATLLVKIAP